MVCFVIATCRDANVRRSLVRGMEQVVVGNCSWRGTALDVVCVPSSSIPARPNLLHKNAFNCFGTIHFVISTKQSLHETNSFACSPANRDKPVAATLQRKCCGGITFAIITKIITKINVPRNYFVIISARMVVWSSSDLTLTYLDDMTYYDLLWHISFHRKADGRDA